LSKGSRRPKSPSDSPKTQVWLFAPSAESESAAQESLRKEAQQAVTAAGWGFIVRRARRCPVVGGPEGGRLYQLIDPRDASEVYSAVHRNRVLILATGSCSMRRDPSADPSRHRDLIGIQNFACYKSRFGMIRERNDLAKHMEEFTKWPHAGACTGPHDPRVLPLHVFDNHSEWLGLNEPKEAERFRRSFGPGGDRTDPDGRSWRQSAAFHGGDALTIAGHALRQGFHWDVTRNRGKERVVTTHQVWKLEASNSYCNMYPDGYVRVSRGRTGGTCRLVWPSS
jgi:hypothetical protein